MFVVKRNGNLEKWDFNKINKRIGALCSGLKINIDYITQKIINILHNKIKTSEVDEISAKIAEELKLIHPDYAILAGRLLVSNLHKNTSDDFTSILPFLNDKFKDVINNNANLLNSMIDHSRDFNFNYVALKTLFRLYLIKNNNIIIERPQYMYMRVAIHLWYDNLDKIKETYDLLSLHYYTHATPTLINACRLNGQLNSCFLLTVEDSGAGIMKTATDSSLISMGAGGVGIDISNIRSRGQIINRTGGKASGVVPVMKIYEACMREFDQGGGRPGACAVYLQVHHADIEEFLRCKLQNGIETELTRDLFTAVVIPDLFMKKYLNGDMWCLFSENTAPGLVEVYDGMEICLDCNYCNNPSYNKYFALDDAKFINCTHIGSHIWKEFGAYTTLYNKYESEKRYVKQIKPQVLIDAICNSQRESGIPYVMFKDAANRNSNQKNIGTITSSNLCIEIMEYHDANSIANCSLASINLRNFVKTTNFGSNVLNAFDFKKLKKVVKSIVYALDKTIDNTDYPVVECKQNHMKYRPIGIGVQGLANVFMELRIPYISEEAKQLDLLIFESIYKYALQASCELAKCYRPYDGFDDSPAKNGIFRFNMGNKLAAPQLKWEITKENIHVFGLRNSLLVALMPTASTSIIFNNIESFEALNSNIYTRTTLSGKYTMINDQLMRHLIELNLWNEEIKDKIIENDGSVLDLEEIPREIREIYKTVWEMKQKDVMYRTALRSGFIDQSQSLNIHITNNSGEILRGIIKYAWEIGLITGSYYIRTFVPKVKNVCYKGCDTCSS